MKLLQELANTSYSFTAREISGDNLEYRFKNSNSEFIVIFTYHKNSMDVIFSEKDYNEKVLKLDNKWKDGITGTGDAFRVFSTVIRIIKKALYNHDEINILHFESSGKEPSRGKLYLRFSKDVNKYLPDWDLKTVTGNIEHGDDIKFDLKRR